MPASPKTDAEELLDPAFLDKLRALFLKLRKRKMLRKKGLQATPSTGFTREFKDFRHYTKNDDYRSIDWRLYARLERLFIRLYEEVQEFHVHILIDTSESMAQPFPEKRKTALKIAVALSYMGLVSQHRVSLYSMSDRVISGLPPFSGQGNIRKIVDHLAGIEFGGITDLEACFSEFRPSRQRYGVIFVISDLFGKEVGSATDALKRTGRWPGEPHLVHVFEPSERNPELDGEVELVDVETKETRRLWLTKRDLKRYRETFEKFVDGISEECLRRQMDYLQWTTDENFEDMFLEMLSHGSVLSKTN